MNTSGLGYTIRRAQPLIGTFDKRFTKPVEYLWIGRTIPLCKRM